MKLFFFSVIVLFAFTAQAALGPIPISLAPVESKSNMIGINDIDAPYSSEIYTSDEITQSGAHTLYDF